MNNNDALFKELCELSKEVYSIDPELYNKYSVKRGLRNSNGSGVLVGLTKVGDAHGYVLDEGEKVADEGVLRYRGINVTKIVKGCEADERFGFEEVVYLLLFGKLPTEDKLKEFTDYLGQMRKLPANFTEDMILKAPSSDLMNKLARSVLALYSYDSNPDDISVENVVRQSMELISKIPVLMCYCYQAYNHMYNNKSLVIHEPDPLKSTSENILMLLRADGKYTPLEAKILDLILMLHAEHGGGNKCRIIKMLTK